MKSVLLKKRSKAEQVFLKELQNRPSDTIFREVYSKAQNNKNNPQEVRKEI